MQKYKLALDKKPAQFINSRTPKEKAKITAALDKLCKNPYRNDLDIKKLKHPKNVYRLRIGNYRFLYKIKNDVLIIFMFDAGHRKDIYR